MLEVQKYLLSGKTLEDLTSEFAIHTCEHPTLPLIGFKYDQIESPKSHPIVRECRGIVLEKETFKLIGASFPRFFNLGEQIELFEGFDWSNFRCDEKLDGSLIVCYFYNNEWHVNTSGSFGLAECNFSGKTWRELFWETSKINKKSLEPFKHLTLIFELWTPYNKVVRTYPEPKVWLLGAFEPNPLDGDPCRELNPRTVDHLAVELGVSRPQSYEFKSADEINTFLKKQEETDPTAEGIVVRDKNNIRAKIKSSTYVALHQLKGNDNLFNPRKLVPLVLAGELDEIIAYFPEVEQTLLKVQAEIKTEWENLKSVWETTYTIPDQKEFALKIMKGLDGKPMTPFSGLLFTLRKTKKQAQTLDDLKTMWRESEDAIVKRLYS